MLISPGDIIDLYFQLLQKRKTGNLLFRLFMPEKLRTETWWNAVSAAPRSWWDVPAVEKRWNGKITGNPEVQFIRYIGRKYYPPGKTVRLLSPGCGEGRKEIEIAGIFPHWKIIGFDANNSRIVKARSTAKTLSLANVAFSRNDISDLDDFHDSFDIILFDSCLHHFTKFAHIFEKCKKLLSDDGLLVVNEYVGPNRFQWAPVQLAEANRILLSIPEKLRCRFNSSSLKSRIYRPGYLRMILTDPSEAVNSREILPTLHEAFSTVEEKPFGGNLLHPVLKDIAHHFTQGNAEADAVLSRLFEEEDRFLENHPSDFMFGIYAPIGRNG